MGPQPIKLWGEGGRLSDKRFTVWSSGGGTQSSAIAVLILKRLLPRPDRAVIADTGRETQGFIKRLKSEAES